MIRSPGYIIEPGQIWRAADCQERTVIAVHTTRHLDQSTIKFSVDGTARTTGRPSFCNWISRHGAVCG